MTKRTLKHLQNLLEVMNKTEPLLYAVRMKGIYVKCFQLTAQIYLPFNSFNITNLSYIQRINNEIK